MNKQQHPQEKCLAWVGLGLLALSLAACQPLTLPLPEGAISLPITQTIERSGDFTYSLDTGSVPRDVYFVFSNTGTTDLSQGGIDISLGALSVDGAGLPLPNSLAAAGRPASGPEAFKARLQGQANRMVSKSRAQARSVEAARALQRVSPAGNDTVGLSANLHNIVFPAGGGDANFISVPATCRLVQSGTGNDGLLRTVSIWVEDARWTIGGDASVDQAMVQALADHFLASSGKNDIYHWETGILGEPWGASAYSNLVAWDAKNTITIFLANLNDPAVYASGSRVSGLYAPLNNFANDPIANPVSAVSNERIMFYMDAKTYGTGEGSWSIDDYWPREIISTLAHEFQHMIMFYQKSILRGADPDTWLNEMNAMLLEDLLAEKIGVPGPRGVAASDGTAGSANNTRGRVPYFNAYLDSDWHINREAPFEIEAYSQAYMLGAWLARNYGGAEFARRMVQGDGADQAAIFDAIQGQTGAPDTMAKLLGAWATAVLLSDQTLVPAGRRYNIGGWFAPSSSQQDPTQSFRLGSLNVWNYVYNTSSGYQSGPWVYTSASNLPPGSLSPNANVYYLAARQLSGKRSWQLSVPANIATTIVVK